MGLLQLWRGAQYALQRGVRGMLQAPFLQVLAISTSAVCMLLLGAVLLVWSNARDITHSWGVDVPVTIYMSDDAPPDQLNRLASRLRQLPQVQQIGIVTPDLARRRLVEGLGGQTELLEGIDATVLPTSLEVRFRPGGARAFDDIVQAELARLEIVDEVVSPGAWIGRAERLISTLTLGVWSAGALVSLACLAIIWTTIRLSVYARRAEIQILQLVGGTSGFVRSPFVVEGALQGALGAGCAMLLLYAGFEAVRPFVGQGLSLLLAAGALRFFSAIEIMMGVVLGATVGILGASAATREVEA